MRLPILTGGGKPGHPLADEKGGLLRSESGRFGLHTLYTASRTFGATLEAKMRVGFSACSWLRPGSRPQKQKRS